MVRRSHESHESAGGDVGPSWLGAAILASVLVFATLKYLGTVNHWKLTQWLFSYELGFVKRGLVGTVVSALAPDGRIPLTWIVALSLGVAVLYLASLAAFAWPAFARPGRRRALLAGLCAVASPGIGYLLSDLGRFDALNYALCLLALFAARACGRFPYPLFLALSGAMLLIHEAALLLALPVLLVAHLDANGRLSWLVGPAHWPALAARLAPVLLLFAALAFAGGVELPLRELLARLAAGADFPPNARSAYVLVRGLDSNVAQILGWERRIADSGAPGPALGPIQLASFRSILPFALAQLAVAHVCLRALARERRRAALAALYLCFLAPFPLLLVGVDWGRWAALAAAHCATLTLLFAPELPDECASPLSFRAALIALLFTIAAAGTPYVMEGTRGDRADSPWSGLQRLVQDARGSESWDRAFVAP